MVTKILSTLAVVLALRTGNRTVTLRAHVYRPGRTYLVLIAR